MPNCRPDDSFNRLSLSDKLVVAAKRLRIIQAFCEIVTVNGRPFEYLIDSGFQRLIKSDLYELEKAGVPIRFSDIYAELTEYIAHVASEIKKRGSFMYDNHLQLSTEELQNILIIKLNEKQLSHIFQEDLNASMREYLQYA